MVQNRGVLSDVTSLQKDINKLFEQLAQFGKAEPSMGLGEWFPRVDVVETTGEVIIKVEAPGFDPDDLSVVFHGPKLLLTGQKKRAKTDESVRGYVCLERGSGSFDRSLYVDPAVDLTRARARLEDGVLTVTLPKLEDRRGSEFRLTIESIDGDGGRDS